MLATCNPGEDLLGGGIALSSLSKGETQWLKMEPFINGPAQTMVGQFESDTGGLVPGKVFAVCLK